jgi:hypothetical protein
MFNKPTSDSTQQHEAGLLNKRSYLAAALGVTKFVAVIFNNLVTLCCAT